MTAVWAIEGLTPSQKLVALCLADSASNEGVCWPSIKNMTKRCGLSERSIQRAISDLEQMNFCHRDMREGRSSIYQLTPAMVTPLTPVTMTPRNNVTPVTVSPPPPSNATLDPRHSDTQNLIVREPSIEPREKERTRKRVEKVSLEELSVDHISGWLAKKRCEGKYLDHDEYFILEQFTGYCQANGKKYDDYIAAYRNAFEWDRCQPKLSAGAKPTPTGNALAALYAAGTESRRKQQERVQPSAGGFQAAEPARLAGTGNAPPESQTIPGNGA